MSPNLRTRLSEVLLGAFDRRGLERLVRKRLGGLDAGVNFDQDPESIAFDLVDVAERRGDVEGLVRGIQAERPNRPDVAELVALFGLPPASGPVAATAAATAGAPAVPGWVRDNVIRLNEQFQQRKLQLRYLGGYKQLHDGLHTLQDLQEGIAQAADRFRRDPEDTLELETIAEQLQELVRAARDGAATLEDPEEVADWLDAFDRAVADLGAAVRAADQPVLGRVVEVLRRLPNEQAGLNAELVRCAKRLRPTGLVETMDAILAELAPAGAAVPPFVAEFRAGLGRFRGLCDRLSGMIRDHNACQDVETALAQAATVPDVTPEAVPAWAAVKAALADLAARRPDDALAGRATEAAGLFEQAAAAGNRRRTGNEFAKLLDRFRRMFNRTDKDLLDVTDELVREAAYLDVQLRTATYVSA